MPTVTVIAPTIMAEEENREIRCAAYCRVSSDSADQLNSFAAQIRYYENFFEGKENERLVEVYADEGVTGTCEDKRDELLRLISDCRKGKIDRIYCKSISRFSRNTKDCLKNVRELKSLGISVFFEKEGIDTAEISDEIFITIMGGLAQEESTSISQNLQWSIHKRMKNGTYNVPTLPYGYDKNNGNFTVNDDAQVVSFIFNEYLNGKGINEICNILNNKEPFKNTKHWCRNSVKYVLTNEKYVGDCLWRKTFTRNVFPFKSCVNNGETEQYYISEHHKAIISKEDFEAVQALLKKRSDYYGNKHFHDYALSKKVFCGNCGSIYRRKKIRNKIHWVCLKHDLDANACKEKWILETDIFNAFICLYNKLLCSYKQILIPLRNNLWQLKEREIRGNSSILELHKEIAKLKEQTHVIARLRTKGFLDENKYIEQSNEISMKLNKLNSEFKKLSQDNEDDTLEQLDMLIDIFENKQKPMTEFDEREFDSIVERITAMGDGRLRFHLIGGLKLTEKI